MQSVSSHRTSLIPLFLSFCSFVLYYEGVLIHLCELASCTFNARYLLCVVRFTMEQERGVEIQSLFYGAAFKVIFRLSSCCLCEGRGGDLSVNG